MTIARCANQPRRLVRVGKTGQVLTLLVSPLVHSISSFASTQVKEIKAEGTSFIYVDADSVADGLQIAKQGSRPGFDEQQAGKVLLAPDVRMALFRWPLPPNSLMPYYLVWRETAGLRQLDFKVQAGAHRDVDFFPSIRTHFQVTRCFSCGGEFDTLVVDAGDPYPGAPDLLRKKIGLFQFKRCPKCEKSLRQLVAKIL